MASYLRSWLPTLSTQQSNSQTTEEEEEESPTTPTNFSLSIEEPDADDNSPPAFPAIGSAQRISSAPPPSSTHLISPSNLMPPPPLPASRIPGPPAPSSASSLMPPPTTTRPPTQATKSKKREKVVLAPGHSPLDWAALKTSGTDLRVGPRSINSPAQQLSSSYRVGRLLWHAYRHRCCARTTNGMTHGPRLAARSTISRRTSIFTLAVKRNSCVSPGVMGRNCSVCGHCRLGYFVPIYAMPGLTHAWVNVDFMLDACLVGFLVPEPSS